MSKLVMLVIALLAADILSTQAFAASAGGIKVRRSKGNRSNSNDGFQAGKTDGVKTAKNEDFIKVKDSDRPICVYIFDSDAVDNTRASLLEGSSGIASAEVRQRLGQFKFIKIKADGTDAKGWPAEWMQKSKNSAALILMSSDLQRVVMFDRDIPKEGISPQSIVAGADSILKYEELRKAEPAKQKK